MTKIDFSIYDYNLPLDIAPEGEHIFEIKDVSFQQSKKAQQSGSQDMMVKFTLGVLEGYAKGSTIVDTIHLNHSNKDAERIGRETLRQMASICDVEALLDLRKDLTCFVGKKIGAVIETQIVGAKNYKKVHKFKNPKDVTVAIMRPITLNSQPRNANETKSRDPHSDEEYQNAVANDPTPY